MARQELKHEESAPGKAAAWSLVAGRELAFGEWGRHCRCNELWARYGAVSPFHAEELPWLRQAQRRGLEVLVVGASAEACRVCMEAWHSGFKVALLIVQDEVRDEEAVSQALAAFRGWEGEKGHFQFGFPVHCAERSECSLSLDEGGEVTEVKAGERSWAGNIIVLDLFPCGSVTAEVIEESAKSAEGEDGAAGAFARRVLLQRRALVEPEFWEERWVPESAPFCVPTYRSVLSSALLVMAVVVPYLYQFKFLKSEYAPYFPLLSAPFGLPLELLFLSTLTNLWLQALGVSLLPHRPCGANLLVALADIAVSSAMSSVRVGGRYYYTDRVCHMAATVACVSLVLVFSRRKSQGSLPMANVRWFFFVALGTYGFYVLMILVLLIYISLVPRMPSAASVFIALAFTSSESLMVKLSYAAYRSCVERPRERSGPNGCVGDQKWVLSSLLLAVHASTESARLISLLTGAARTQDPSFAASALFSVALSVALNVANRSSWLLCLGAKLFGTCWTRRLCPSFVTVLHTECKFSLGWPRFFVVLAVAATRALLWGKWSPRWLLVEDNVWCFSGLVAATFLMVFAGEGLEDLLVYLIDRRLAAPLRRCFSAEFQRRFSAAQGEPFHVRHFLIPNGRCSGRASRHSQETGWGRSPNFQQVRALSVWRTLPAAAMCFNVISAGFDTGLGYPSMLGFCGPKELGGSLRSMALLSLDCAGR